jgi:hypothetical protein
MRIWVQRKRAGYTQVGTRLWVQTRLRLAGNPGRDCHHGDLPTLLSNNGLAVLESDGFQLQQLAEPDSPSLDITTIGSPRRPLREPGAQLSSA